MNFWRAIFTLVAIAFVGIAMTVDLVGLVKAHHDERASSVERQEQAEKASLERICKAMFPRSGTNRIRCLEEGL